MLLLYVSVFNRPFESNVNDRKTAFTGDVPGCTSGVARRAEVLRLRALFNRLE